MTPYDPRAAALDALAAMRWPDVSEPPAEQVEAVEAYLRAMYGMGAAGFKWDDANNNFHALTAWATGREGRPMVPPA